MTVQFKFGRTRPPPVAQRRMHVPLGDFLGTSLPKRPPATNYATKAQHCLRQVLLNDQLGCCTASGAFHVEGVLLSNASQPGVTFRDWEVRDFYANTTGYIPGHPDTDRGGDEITVLDYWRDHGLVLGRHRIAGHVSVDATDAEQVKTALWLFENLYFGVELPAAWVRDPRDGFRWDVAGDPVPENGHCYVGVDYDDHGYDGVRVASWGLTGTMTLAAVRHYAVRAAGGELHCVVSAEGLVRGMARAPNGLDWVKLVAAFQQMGGHLV